MIMAHRLKENGRKWERSYLYVTETISYIMWESDDTLYLIMRN